LISNKTVTVVLPAFNAEKTLEKTYREIPFDIVDDVILVDDFSSDETFSLAQDLGIPHRIEHSHNVGYGGNQKTCFNHALSLQADIVIVLHPDYQYTPRLIRPMCQLIADEVHDVVLASRILGGGAIKGGMPLYKYAANRLLTATQNLIIGQKLSEYHTGYRAYSRHVLEKINYKNNSDGFLFDNQILSQIFLSGFRVGEISCPTLYDEDSSSISFLPSLSYGCGVLITSLMHFLQKMKIFRFRIYDKTTN
jgi:glycosyltransferase involved in cell wall biosynthesis|tara:strand:+ start:1195 stop:1947 length:753 start_codon:yes stop_codon:yes gene_type:complete